MTWVIEQKDYSQRRACGLVGMDAKTWRYRSRRNGDKPLRPHQGELAADRRRFSYRQLLILLRREGQLANHKRLTVRKRGGHKRAIGSQAPRLCRTSLEPALEPRLRVRRSERWPPLPNAGDRRHLSRECLALVVRSPGCPGARQGHRASREAAADRERRY